MTSAATAPAVIRAFSLKVYARIGGLGWLFTRQRNRHRSYGIFRLPQRRSGNRD
jgi:hypothetical protein